MSSRVTHITFDSHDPYALGSFWAQVVGGRLQDDDSPGDPAALVTTDDGLALLFEKNPDDKQVKNRVHLDLQPGERTRDDEVKWLESIGATVYDDQRRPDGTGWVVMRDPEGNEFCVERSAAERAG
jgi:predicted enzyme related to lactoylglutathione lyase